MISDAIIDVWEHEPEINRDLLEKTFIGTPHIAGYSADGKANATRMSLDAICNFFQIKGDYEINAPAPVSPIIHAKNHEEAVLQMYNLRVGFRIAPVDFLAGCCLRLDYTFAERRESIHY